MSPMRSILMRKLGYLGRSLPAYQPVLLAVNLGRSTILATLSCAIGQLSSSRNRHRLNHDRSSTSKTMLQEEAHRPFQEGMPSQQVTTFNRFT